MFFKKKKYIVTRYVEIDGQLYEYDEEVSKKEYEKVKKNSKKRENKKAFNRGVMIGTINHFNNQ